MIMNNHKVALSLLGGSINRNLHTDSSDRDMKYFVLPTMEELYNGKMYSDSTNSDSEDIEIHDVRKLDTLLFKSNLTYLELLYSVEIKTYYPEMQQLIEMRDEIIKMNLSGLYSSCLGIYNREFKSLQNANSDKQKSIIEKYGYNPKKAMMCLHFLNFIIEFEHCEFNDFNNCFCYDINERDFMLDVKNGKYELATMKNILEVQFNIAKRLEFKYKNQQVNHQTYDKVKDLLYQLVKREIKNELNKGG